MGAAARAFSWIHPAVYPLYASMALGMGFCAYSCSHHLFSNPDVRILRSVRADPMMDNATTQARIEEYRTNIFRSAAATRSQAGGYPNTRIF